MTTETVENLNLFGNWLVFSAYGWLLAMLLRYNFIYLGIDQYLYPTVNFIYFTELILVHLITDQFFN